MKAVSCEHGKLSVVDLPEPRPVEGQLVLDVRACGICGSDLHAKDHADDLTGVMAKVGYPDFMRTDTATVMGHEFAGVIAEVPFVDAVNTMSDPTLPLTINEWDEWGDPRAEPIATLKRAAPNHEYVQALALAEGAFERVAAN